LLRADLHRLFDTGYATVTPDLRLEISDRLREDYRNGRSYYPLRGWYVNAPTTPAHRPDKMYLEWHNQHVYRG
jgi:putative restriction endonuclease